MLEVALINYIGAGLGSFAPVYNLSLPQGATVDGAELLRQLNRWNCDRTAKFTTTAVERIWAAWGGFEQPDALGLLHLQKLPGILLACGPDKDALAGALAAASTETIDREAAIAAAAGRLSTQIVAQAKQQNLLQPNGLNEAAAFVFLKSLYSQLLLSSSFLDDAQHILRHRLRTVAVSNASAAALARPDTAKVADAHGVSLEDRAKPHGAVAIARSVAENGRITSMQAEQIAARTKCSVNRAEVHALCNDLIAELEHICKLQPALREAIAEVHLQFMAGDLSKVEAGLLKANANLASTAGREPQHAELRARIRCVRGLLWQLQGRPGKAARYYAAAAKVLPRTDYGLYWQLVERRARALISQSEKNAEPTAIEAAIEICASAIVELHLMPSQACYVHAKALLGQLLAMGSAHGLHDDRNRAAVRYLREAAAHYKTNGPAASFFNARFYLAQALTGIGNRTQNAACLEEAIRLYQTLLTGDTAEFGQRDEIVTWLGLALAGLGNIQNSQDTLQLARDTLRCGLRTLQADAAPSRRSLLVQGYANAVLARQLIDASGNGASNREADALLRLAQSNLHECAADRASERLGQGTHDLGETPGQDLPLAMHSPSRLENAENSAHALHGETAIVKDEPVSKGIHDYLFRLRASMRQSSAEKQERSKSRRRLFG